jgi:hypothetical protein
MIRYIKALTLTLLMLVSFGCHQQQQLQQGVSTPTYVYVAGYTAYMRGSKAVAPSTAPKNIKKVIAAGNKIVNRPYRMGGGHGKHHDTAYDCSGSVGFVLREAGMMGRTQFRSSRQFLSWGSPGFGKWLTLYVKRGHVFLVVAGLRFDTSGTRTGIGPRWYTKSRRCDGFYVRHIRGL